MVVEEAGKIPEGVRSHGRDPAGALISKIE